MIRIRGRVDDVLVVSLVARTVISLIGGFAFGFVGWLIAWLTIPFFQFTHLAMPVVGSAMLGLTTGVSSAFIFRETGCSWAFRAGFPVFVIGVSIAACAVTYSVSSDNPGYTYLTRGVVFPMINAGAFTATVVGAAGYLWQELFLESRGR